MDRVVGFYCPMCFKPWVCLQSEVKHPTVRRCPYERDGLYCIDPEARKRGYGLPMARMEGKCIPEDLVEVIQVAKITGGVKAARQIIQDWLLGGTWRFS